MIFLIDTSVWIDLLAARETPQTPRRRALIAAHHELLIGNLVLTEILQGTRRYRDHDRKLTLLDSFSYLTIVDRRVGIKAARNYRALHQLGVTIRKTVDMLIAGRPTLDGIALPCSDRDFDPFVRHLGLRSAMH